MNAQNELNEEDREMAKYIISVLTSDVIVLMSWGFNNPLVIKDGLQFNVKGYIHQGKVQIIYQHGMDLFQVKLLLNDGTLIKDVNEVYVEDLLTLIDESVEKVVDYDIYIMRTLKLNKSQSN